MPPLLLTSLCYFRMVEWNMSTLAAFNSSKDAFIHFATTPFLEAFSSQHSSAIFHLQLSQLRTPREKFVMPTTDVHTHCMLYLRPRLFISLVNPLPNAFTLADPVRYSSNCFSAYGVTGQDKYTFPALPS